MAVMYNKKVCEGNKGGFARVCVENVVVQVFVRGTSICGTPLGAGGMPVNSNLPSW